MMRLFRNLFRFLWAGERCAELRRDLRTTYETKREQADATGQDYFLKRDMARLKEENERKQK